MKQRETLLIVILVLIAAVPRLLLLSAEGAGIESDEAIVGLMAKHITEGKPWPVFYYGQAYMGSLEAILAAGFFLLFGVSSLSLKLVPFCFSLLLIACVYKLARKFCDPLGAGVAALLTALGPSALIQWSLKARGGFIELVVIGTLALIMAVGILRTESPKARQLFLLGLVLGLGWWVNNQIIFYCAAIGLVFVVHFFRETGLKRSFGFLFISLAGFFLGGAPFWWKNVTGEPRFASFEVLFGQRSPHGTGFIDHISGFFANAAPMILGARRFWSRSDVFQYSSLLAGLGFVLILACLFWQWRSRREELRGLSLVLLFLLVVPLIFSLSSFGWLSRAPRYLIPMYSALYVVVGIVIAQLWQSGRFHLRALAIFEVLLFLGLNLSSNYLGGIAISGQPIVFKGQRVDRDHSRLISWLAENNYSHVQTNYWIGYRLAFETAERVTFTRFGDPRTLRIPEYEARNILHKLAANPYEERVYVLVPLEADVLSDVLDKTGVRYRETQVGAYVVIDHLRPLVMPGAEIQLKPGMLSASSRTDWTANLIDEELGTRWGSGQPQSPGMYLEVAFPEPREIAALEVDMGFFVHDAAREMSVEGKGPDGQWCTIANLHRNRAMIDVSRVWRLYFEPRELTHLRLVQQGSHPLFDWSVAELSLFGKE